MIKKRCGHCTNCKDTCDKIERVSTEWCDPCTRKKEGRGNKVGCHLRQDCTKVTDQEQQTDGEECEDEVKKLEAQEKEERKRKPTESPLDKQTKQKPRAGELDKLAVELQESPNSST